MDQAPRVVKFEEAATRRREAASMGTRTRPRGPYKTQDETGGSLTNPPKGTPRSAKGEEPRGPYAMMDETGGKVDAGED